VPAVGSVMCSLFVISRQKMPLKKNSRTNRSLTRFGFINSGYNKRYYSKPIQKKENPGS
jgi:hypothetical protein